MKTLFETYLKLTGYDISFASNELKRIQSLSSKGIRKWQDNKKWVIARYLYDNNPLYRKKVGKYFPDKWEDLPIMEKFDYQDDLEKLFSKGYTKKNTYIANTSGSSGHPFFFARNKEAHAMTWALIKKMYNWHGINLNSKQARFYGTPLETTSKRQEQIKDYIINRVRFPIFDMSDEILENFLIKFRSIKFEYIYGYTNSLVLFARYLIINQIVLGDVCPTLKVCIPTSETITKEDEKILIEGFGVKVVNEYGVSEVGGIVAFEDQNENWRLAVETQFVEILDEKNNPVSRKKSGDIIITDLHNKVMPFIRYRVGDLGVLTTDKTKSEGYPLLKKLLGRTNDTIQLPSGKISPGLTFYYISRSVLESSGVLKEFIIRQTAIDMFVFDIVSNRDLNDYEVKEIEDKMRLYLEPGLKLEINRVPKINRPPSGKIKHFYSEINK